MGSLYWFSGRVVSIMVHCFGVGGVAHFGLAKQYRGGTTICLEQVGVTSTSMVVTFLKVGGDFVGLTSSTFVHIFNCNMLGITRRFLTP